MARFQLLCGSVLLLVVGICRGYEVVLDLKEDMSPDVWRKISCRYVQDYKGYNDTRGCTRVSVYPLKESYFEDVPGAWGVCSYPQCTLLYFDGTLPPFKGVSVKRLVGGEGGEIRVAASRSLVIPSSTIEVFTKTTDDPEHEVWTESEVDATGAIYYVLEITMSVTDENSFAVLDKVVIDYGADVSAPPDPTTKAPEPPVFEYTIDTLTDVSSEFTRISCNYADHLEEFWVWGCPKDTEEPADTIGFWAPCQTPSCDFIFNAGKSRDAKVAQVHLRGVFPGDVAVTISKRPHRLGSFFRQVAQQVVRGEAVNEILLDLYEDCTSGVYNISISGNGFIDSMRVTLLDDNEECLPTGPTGPTEPSTSPGEGDGDDGGGAASVTASLLMSLLALFLISNVFQL